MMKVTFLESTRTCPFLIEAPNLWERLLREVKGVLRSILGDAVIPFVPKCFELSLIWRDIVGKVEKV